MEASHEVNYYPETEDWEGSYTWVIIVFVIIVVIGLLLWIHLGRGSSSLGPIYTFSSSGSSSTESFVASNFSAFVATAPSSGMKLTVTPSSANPTGEQFMVDNSSGAGSVTVLGPSVTGNKPVTGVSSSSPPNLATAASNVVPRGNVAVYVWKTSSSAVRVS